MLNLEFKPCPPLVPYVKLIWALESEDPSIFGNGHRIFPDGIVEIVFHYGDHF